MVSELLQPWGCVRWKHEGGWKVGKRLLEFTSFEGARWVLIQCPEGVYYTLKDDVERQPMHSEWEGEE